MYKTNKNNSNTAIVWRRCFMVFLLITIMLIPLLLTGCSKQKNSLILNEYLIYEEDGLNTYGELTIMIDYESMVSAADWLSTEEKLAAMEFGKTYTPFQYSIDQTSGKLSNGDQVNIQFSTEKDAFKEFKSLIKAEIDTSASVHTMSKLSEIQDIDPFKYLVIDHHNSIDGKGAVDCVIELEVDGKLVTWPVSHDGNNGSLKNGDTITLTISDEIDFEAFEKKTGQKITTLNKQHEISELLRPATDNLMLNIISEDVFNPVDIVVKEWVISGLNDETPMREDTVYYLVGTMFFNSCDTTENVTEPVNGTLVMLYEINDIFMSDPYYVMFALTGEFSWTYNDMCYNGELGLPDSFVKYDKETVRYTDTFGWGQNSEPMGFLYNGNAYAGKATLEASIAYIDSLYQNQYTNRFVSDTLTLKLQELSFDYVEEVPEYVEDIETSGEEDEVHE